MDKELCDFFGRAKKIALLPQERADLKQRFTERKVSDSRHTSCMKQPNPDLMNTASAIGLSVKEKRSSRKEIKSFMRSHPVKKDQYVSSPWSLQRMFPIYAPVLAVTLIIMANTQKWGEQAIITREPEEFLNEADEAISAPIYPFFMKSGQEGDEEDPAVLLEEPQQERKETTSPPPSSEPQEEIRVRIDPKSDAEVPQPQQLDDSALPAFREKPQKDQSAGRESTQRMRSIKNEQPSETKTLPAVAPAEIQQSMPAEMKTTTEDVYAPSLLLTRIDAAEERLESLRSKSEESEESTSLFKQAEQLLAKARAFSDVDEDLAMGYVQEAESLMDIFESL